MIEDNNAFDAWKKSLKYVKENGKSFVDTDKRNCIEVQNLKIKISNINKNIEKPLNYMMGFKDWFYPSKQELVSTMFGKEKTPFYGYTYGKRMFNYAKELDQINDFIIPLLQENKNSRRAIISFFNPVVDSKPSSKDVPGLIYIQVRILEDKVCLNISIRSNDLFFGWPSNVFQLYTLQKYLSEKLRYETGSITTISNSAHIFEEHLVYMSDLL